jgi:hypothetical protein
VLGELLSGLEHHRARQWRDELMSGRELRSFFALSLQCKAKRLVPRPQSLEMFANTHSGSSVRRARNAVSHRHHSTDFSRPEPE